MEKTNYKKSLFIGLIFLVAFMILHLFIIEVSFSGTSNVIWMAWLIGVFCTNLFRKSKYKVPLIIFTSIFLLFILYKGIPNIPDYIIIFIMIFFVFLSEIIKEKSKYMKLEILTIVILFIGFFSLNYYLSSTRPIKSLNLNRVIARQNAHLDKITEKTLLQVSSLYVSDSQFTVTDLEGIEYLKNLYRLSLWNRHVKDYTPIEQLRKLSILYISDGDLDELQNLSEMASVEQLDITYPKKGTLNNLKSFPNLKSLRIQGGSLSDLGTLQGPNNLEMLSIGDCKVSKFNGIENFENLKEIHLYMLGISDSSKLLSLKKLEKISFSDCYVSDIEELKEKARERGIIIEGEDRVKERLDGMLKQLN